MLRTRLPNPWRFDAPSPRTLDAVEIKGGADRAADMVLEVGAAELGHNYPPSVGGLSSNEAQEKKVRFRR